MDLAWRITRNPSGARELTQIGESVLPLGTPDEIQDLTPGIYDADWKLVEAEDAPTKDEADPISAEQYAAGALPEVGAEPIPMRNERVSGQHELSGSGYELYVNPTTIQLVEMLKRSSKNLANINVYSRRDIAAAIAEDMKHAEIHEAMVTHAHPLATQDRRRMIMEEGIGRWRVVGQAGVPLQVLNAEGRSVDRSYWPAALLNAIPDGMTIDAFKEEEHPRGQPENAGQFTSAAAGGSKKKASITAKPLEANPGDPSEFAWNGHGYAKSTPISESATKYAARFQAADESLGKQAFSPDETHALKVWTHTPSIQKKFSAVLRKEGGRMGAANLKMLEDIDSAFASKDAVTDRDLRVSRGTTLLKEDMLRIYEEFQATGSAEYKDPSFVATSAHAYRGRSQDYGKVKGGQGAIRRSLLLTILVPEGSRAIDTRAAGVAPVGVMDKEILLDRGGSFKFVNMRRDGRETSGSIGNPRYSADVVWIPPKHRATTDEVEQPRERSKSIEQTVDIKFIKTNGTVDIDWTEREIRNALEEQVQLQQSEMYFGDPELTNSLMAARLERPPEEEEE